MALACIRSTGPSGQRETAARRSATCASTLWASITTRARGASARASEQQLGGVEVIEVHDVDRPLGEQMPERRPEVRPCVPGVSERAAAEHAGGFGPGPGEGAVPLARGHHPAAELRTQPRGVSPRQIRGEDRDLERPVQRAEELECTDSAAGIGGKGDPWNNVENIHRERACASSEPLGNLRPAGRRAKGSSDDRRLCPARPPHRSVR